jgi:hypothetical protein
MSSSKPLLSEAEKPWRKGKDGGIIINWDYDDGDGVTLRERKRQATERLTKKNGAAWVADAKARLDDEFEMMVTMGFVT